MTAETVTSDLRLTEWTSCGGCAAKWGAALLDDLVARPPAAAPTRRCSSGSPRSTTRRSTALTDDVALVSTTDFFPPLVDDPADFGAIAAANACSDVFAMGGRVVLAINVAAFPEHFPRDAIAAIFEAAARWSPRPAAPSPAATRSATRSRSSGSPCRASCTPTGCSARAGARPGDVLCCRSRSAPA